MSSKNKNLIRPKEGGVIGGVCLGLGNFFSLDPTLIRLIFVIITLLGGSGILMYLILWLIIPAETSPGRLDESSIRENVEEMKEKAKGLGKGAKALANSGNSRYLFGVCLLILGVALTLSNFGFFRFFNLAKLWPLALVFLAFAILKENGK